MANSSRRHALALAVSLSALLLPPAAARAGVQDDIIAAAESYLGKPYVFGGRDGRSGCRGGRRCEPGIDCQSLIFFAFERALGRPWTRFSVMSSVSVRRGELGFPVPGLDGVLRKDVDEHELRKGDVLLFLLEGYNLEAEPPLWVRDGREYGVWHTGLMHGLEGRAARVIHAKPGDAVVSETLREVDFDALYVLRLAFTEIPPRGRPEVVHVEPGAFGPIYVIDEAGRRTMRFGSLAGDDQSIISLVHPDEVQLEYVRDAFAALVLAKAPARVLMIGLGGGAFSSRLRQSLPEVRVDVVEIDPKVVSVARRFFGVRPDARLRVHVDDGRRFLDVSTERYDLILVDAYSGDGIPAHLSDQGFFALVAGHLSPAGVAVANLAVDEEVERKLAAAFKSAFPQLACLRAPNDDNLLLFGGRGGWPSGASLRREAEKVRRRLGWPARATENWQRLQRDCVPAGAAAAMRPRVHEAVAPAEPFLR